MMSKGSKSRVLDNMPKYRKNYDKINWTKKCSGRSQGKEKT